MFYPNMMYGYGYAMAPYHWVGTLFWIFFWILVVALIVKAVKKNKHAHWEGWGDHKSAMGILRERYAKGEISKEEFEERKRVLEAK